MDDGGSAVSLIWFFLLLGVHVVLYGFGAAIQALNIGIVREKAETKQDKKSVKLEHMMECPSALVGTIQFAATFVDLVMGGFYLHLGLRFVQRFDIKVPGMLLLLLVGLALLLILQIFGVLVPKKLALRSPYKWAYFFVNIMYWLVVLLRPFTAFVDVVTNVILRILGINPHEKSDGVSEEGIISMVNEGQEQGVLQASEAEMITNIFEFTDKEAKDIMTHRTNIVGIEGNLSLKEAVVFMLRERHSRYPVYIENIDHIIGVLHLKDACRALEDKKNENRAVKALKNLVWEAVFIPETRNVEKLFRSMQSEKIHMVIVADEYGQTAGLLAMEDILEEIVGNIFDEYDEEKQTIEEKGKDEYVIDALTPLEELGEKLGIVFEDEEFETLNGLMISKLERIPEENETFDMDYDGYNFKVLSVENKRIGDVLATRLEKSEPAGGQE